MPRFNLLSIIIPVYNEAGSLEELFLRIKAVFGEEQPYEVIFVDDGSSDGSGEILAGLAKRFPQVTVLSHYRNHGKSLALMQGFDAAKGEAVVTMDADLQDLPESIPTLLDKLAEGYDLVNGWRTARQDNYSKILASRAYNYITARLLKCPLHDINCGFKAMRIEVCKRLNLRGDLHRLIPAIASQMYGFKVTEAPVPHEERRYGKSKYSLVRFRGLLDIVSLMAVSTTQVRPFHVFTELALVFVLLGILGFGGWFLLSLSAAASSFAKLILSLLWLAGALFLFLGTILPLLGFQLEIITGILQDEKWRHNLLKKPPPGDLED
ncbi:MAG: glycosyltransferase [Deltaproteobacteria bacterium]|nr:MAG: glycosyltransferase [Deltaproteobacteria bacterium]